MSPDPWENNRWSSLTSNLAAEDLNRSSASTGSVADTSSMEISGKSGSLWGGRLWLVVRMLFWWILGLFLVVLPWSHVWNENNLLWKLPAIQPLLVSRFARGACTGLGLIDMWIGIWDAIRYQEPRP